MSYSIYYPNGNCGTNLPNHTPAPCPDVEIEQGRVRSVAMIHESAVDDIKADPSSPEAWLAAIALKKVRVISATQGSFDGGTPVKATGYGNLKERVTGIDFVVNFKDPNYKPNAAFYNALAKANGWYIAWCSETQIHVSDKPALFVPKNEIGEDINSEVVWGVEASFTQSEWPAPHDIPAGVFDPVFDYVP